MKWYPKNYNPKIGETRIIEKFLFFPETFKNKKGIYETRWLETCEVLQEFTYVKHNGINWVDRGWG